MKSVDPLADDLMQVDKSPYAYAWNDPVNLTDPDGQCPWCIGAAVGAALDYGSQVLVNVAQGKDLGTAMTDVDGGSILLSAAAGAAGVGIAQNVARVSRLAQLGKKTSVAVRVGSELATDATVSVVTQQVNDGEIDATKVVRDIAIGQAARGTVGEYVKGKAAQTGKGKQLQNVANREKNVAQRGSSTQRRQKSDADVPGSEAAQATYLSGYRAAGSAAAAGTGRRLLDAATSDDESGSQ